jgi:hypothetical protein
MYASDIFKESSRYPHSRLARWIEIGDAQVALFGKVG